MVTSTDGDTTMLTPNTKQKLQALVDDMFVALHEDFPEIKTIEGFKEAHAFLLKTLNGDLAHEIDRFIPPDEDD